MTRCNSVGLFSLLAFFLTLTNAQANGQTTLYVDDNTCPAIGAGTQANPLCRIQRAIELSQPGDEIVVAQGTYNELINFIRKGVSVRSADGAVLTVIDAGPVVDPGTGKPVVRFDSGEGSDSVFDGFTLTGGTGQASKSGDFLGGGMFIFNSSPTIMNCMFSGNTATDGGGIFISSGSVMLIGCSFDENTAVNNGGGMNAKNGSQASLTDCTFTGNSASNGGGIHSAESNFVLTRCTFSNNTASGSGGGIFNTLSDATVTNCTFEENSAAFVGGGMFNQSSSPIVTNTSFIGNTTIGFGSGAGMYNTGSNPTVANCIFSGNIAGVSNCCPDGGGMYNINRSNPTVISSTFTGNSVGGFGVGGGISNSSGITILSNCIFSNNIGHSSAPQVFTNFNATTIIKFNNIEGSGGSTNWSTSIGTDGGGNIDADPLFVDADGADNIVGTLDDDLRLSPSSPSIDAGFSFGTLLDLDGNTRIVDAPATPDTGVGFPIVIDMGAYEFGSSAPGGNPDLDLDGDVDAYDYCIMQAAFTGPIFP